MADYRRLAMCGVMVSDTSRGRVRSLAGRPVVRYDVNATDRARLRQGIDRLGELFRAAGAREVYPADTRRLMAFHPLGTARADARPDHGVVDGDLRLHGVRGVHVADGSAVPSSLGVNPQLTIMALATRLAFGLLGRPVPPTHEELACPS
jgi:choline dehydrogenase-like flavoprotein